MNSAITSLVCFFGTIGSVLAADYQRDIKPLLLAHCATCHGALKQNGELRLDAGALIPGDKHAEILLRVTSSNDDERMPPEGKLLTVEQVALLRDWIAAGAPFPKDEKVPGSPQKHWSFQPIHRPTVPASKYAHPLDAFLFSLQTSPTLASDSSLPSSHASPNRDPAHRDALELPHVANAPILRRLYLDLIGLPPTIEEQTRFADNPDLINTIDTLLSRPEYGERWARHWLDVVRYADSNGYERDAEKPFVWRYRDYVIEAFNNDKPYDRFIMEQIAGDELPDATVETHIATGYLRLGHWDDEPADPPTDRYDQLDDIVSTTGQVFLGLTIGCARCHDHKFEPLTARDYYSLVSIFEPLERPRKGRTELTINKDNTEIYAWQEPAGKPPESTILVRGSVARRGEVVKPAVPEILVLQQPIFPTAGEATTRRRLGLAQWIADEGNPLTARVIVNRVWQHHFGEGLVATANDFGLMGAAPSQPELLDWLAHWFMHDAQWSLKKLHRLILTSQAWQGVKSAQPPFVYRRLEAEAIRDSILAVSGQLNPKRFGPAFFPSIPLAAIEANTDKEKVWQASSESEASRRSIYAFIKRGLVVPMFETLDFADTVNSCPKRQITTVAPQALTLFNGEFVNLQARHFANRLRGEAGDNPNQQIELAWRLAMARAPSPEERDQLQAFLAEESLEQLCRVIFNLNEFVYPE